MANSLFKVESPPLVGLHSDASIVTCNLPRDGCSSPSFLCEEEAKSLPHAGDQTPMRKIETDLYKTPFNCRHFTNFAHFILCTLRVQPFGFLS